MGLSTIPRLRTRRARVVYRKDRLRRVKTRMRTGRQCKLCPLVRLPRGISLVRTIEKSENYVCPSLWPLSGLGIKAMFGDFYYRLPVPMSFRMLCSVFPSIQPHNLYIKELFISDEVNPADSFWQLQQIRIGVFRLLCRRHPSTAVPRNCKVEVGLCGSFRARAKRFIIKRYQRC